MCLIMNVALFQLWRLLLLTVSFYSLYYKTQSHFYLENIVLRQMLVYEYVCEFTLCFQHTPTLKGSMYIHFTLYNNGTKASTVKLNFLSGVRDSMQYFLESLHGLVLVFCDYLHVKTQTYDKYNWLMQNCCYILGSMRCRYRCFCVMQGMYATKKSTLFVKLPNTISAKVNFHIACATNIHKTEEMNLGPR